MLLVFLGGGVGSILRYACTLFIPSTPFPWATLAVNAIGSLLIGFFSAKFYPTGSNASSLYLLLATGLCGGFTTFSTFSKESFNLMQQQQWATFFLYIIGSIVLCLGSIAVGFYAGK